MASLSPVTAGQPVGKARFVRAILLPVRTPSLRRVFRDSDHAECLDEWQDIWDCCRGNKLHAIYATVGTATHSKHSSRYDLVLLNRLQIGHCHITHSGDYPPSCTFCGHPLTVKHVLLECTHL